MSPDATTRKRARFMDYHVQRAAEEDVQQIVFYIAEANLHAADAFRAAIEKARATLEDLPEIGSSCDFDSQEITDLRMLPVLKFKNLPYLLPFYLGRGRDSAGITWSAGCLVSLCEVTWTQAR
jgi:plasmid stabilization system protein ParE